MGCAEPEAFEMRIGSREAKRVQVCAALDARGANGSHSVVIRDLSVTGARVEAKLGQWATGDIVNLRLPLLPAEQRGVIVWSAGAFAGIEFCAPLDQLTLQLLANAMRPSDGKLVTGAAPVPGEIMHEFPVDDTKQRAERAEVAIGANCRTAAGRRGFVAMIDLTPAGCCIFGRDIALAAGQHLTLQPGCLAALKAKVQWTNGSMAGVLFDRPLYPSVFEHLASTHPWPLPEPVKLALAPQGYVPEAAQRELSRMIERAQRAFNSRSTQQDVLTTRPPIVGTRPGIAAQTINRKLAHLLFR